MTKGTLKDARNRISEREGVLYTVKNPACVGRLLGNYLWGETPKKSSVFTVRSGDEERTYSRDDLERIVEQVMKDVELVEVRSRTK